MKKPTKTSIRPATAAQKATKTSIDADTAREILETRAQRADTTGDEQPAEIIYYTGDPATSTICKPAPRQHPKKAWPTRTMTPKEFAQAKKTAEDAGGKA